LHRVFYASMKQLLIFQFNLDNLKTVTIGNKDLDIEFSVQDTNNLHQVPHNQKIGNPNNINVFGSK